MEQVFQEYLPLDLIRHIILPYAWDSMVSTALQRTFKKTVLDSLIRAHWQNENRNFEHFPINECGMLFYYGRSNDDRHFPKPCHYHVFVRGSLDHHLHIHNEFLKDDGDSFRYWFEGGSGWKSISFKL